MRNIFIGRKGTDKEGTSNRVRNIEKNRRPGVRLKQVIRNGLLTGITSRIGNYMIALALLTMLLFVLSGCNKEELPITNEELGAIESSTNEEKDRITEETKKTADVTQTEKQAMSEPAYPMQYGDVVVKQENIYLEDFEAGQTKMKGRGAAQVRIQEDEYYDGANSLYVTGRTALWNGATVDLSELMVEGVSYQIQAYVMYKEGPDTIEFDCKVEKNKNEYLNFASNVVKKGEWTPLQGNIIIPEGTKSVSVYIETLNGGNNTEFIDFYVDGIILTKEEITAERGILPALKEVYQERYLIGVAATVNETSEDRRQLISEQFNSFTPGNELKPESLLDYAACVSDPAYNDNPQINFEQAEPLFRFCKEHNIKMRGHVLVWHSQTPRWFFAENYSKEPEAPFVSKELMEKRLENYIKNVLEYTQTNYPGMIYAWDVVNEAINPGDGGEAGMRSKDSLWYQVIGPEFVEKAFEYARTYASPEVKLFYNDYNTEDSARMIAICDLVRGLKEKKLIDGIGLQTHISVASPSLMDIENSIRRYGELGLELQITELDMGMQDKTEEAYMHQATRYKRLFTLFKHLDETETANITNITFWGLSDDISWLSKPGAPSYPLLFDQYLIQKPAFWGVILSEDIPLY